MTGLCCRKDWRKTCLEVEMAGGRRAPGNTAPAAEVTELERQLSGDLHGAGVTAEVFVPFGECRIARDKRTRGESRQRVLLANVVDAAERVLRMVHGVIHV